MKKALLMLLALVAISGWCEVTITDVWLGGD